MKLDCRPKCLPGGRSDCCARRCLQQQRDFQQQKGALQESIEACGHLVLFYPKFHCKLNFIEFFWAAAKRYARESCEYSLQGLRETIPKALKSVTVLPEVPANYVGLLSIWYMGVPGACLPESPSSYWCLNKVS